MILRSRHCHFGDTESPRKPCALRPSGHKAPAVHAFPTTWSRYSACLRADNAEGYAQRAQSNPPCLRKALLNTSASSPAQSKPCFSSNRKYLCSCHILQLASSKGLFGFDEGACGSQGNSVQMYPNLNNSSSRSLSFTYFCARRDVKLHQELKLVLGVAVLSALQAWYSGCHFAASDELRHHALSHGWWEVALKSHNPDTHSRFINL